MKNIIVLFAFLIASCSTPLFAQQEVERALGDFKAVSVDYGIQAELLKGTSNKVVLVISGTKENNVITEVEAGQLLVTFKNTKKLEGVSVSAKIYTASAIEGITVRNKSSLSVKDVSAASSLKLVATTGARLDMTAKTQSAIVSIGRSAKAQLAIEATKLDATTSGKGKLEITGKAEILKVNANSSGVYKGFGLQCKSLTAQAHGNGRAEVSVSESLVANVVSEGKVIYRGDPKLKVNATSSGIVEKAED
ncbi:GIN domain-containing protein [Reichenbachiella sp.]|uniref:GIN domain-containing protein n=1 Tax=Reichenbachiella sp. TaxID=2184521 RepID=UPI003B5BE067